MPKYHVKQNKLPTATTYTIPLGDGSGYRFSFDKGTLISRTKKEMRKVAVRLGYKPLELYNRRAMNWEWLLTKNEVEFIDHLEGRLNASEEVNESSSAAVVESGTTEAAV